MQLSPSTIDVLADMISGGSASMNTPPPIGIYRSGPDLERFMRACNVDFSIGAGSRVPSLTSCLINLNRDNDGITLTRIIEAAADPRPFAKVPEKHEAVLQELNRVLRPDGLELQERNGKYKVSPVGAASAVLDHLAAAAEVIDFDTVKRDLGRALESAERDAEDAVTAACSVVESVCRSVLVELKLPLPAKKDIQSLYKVVRDPLGLGPERGDLPDEVRDDIRKILSGLVTSVEGIGALRTHAGDAHGRERGYKRIDAHIARLAIHAASTLALFIIETWQRKFPSKDLLRH